MRLQITASLELDELSPRIRFAAIAALVVAGLVTIASLGGLLSPAIYARESATMRAQGIGQDWVNLLVAVPWLVTTAILVLRGARRSRLLLGGALAYASYAYLTYAIAVHFNALFLVYCATLGLATYALVALTTALGDVRGWFHEGPHRAIGGFEMAFAVAVALVWLSEIVPALARGTDPPGLAETGLFTNPIHVLDLALALPALFTGGWLLWRRRAVGYVIAPIGLGFLVLILAAIAGMAIAQRDAAVAGSVGVAIGVGALALVAAALLGWMVYPLRSTSVAHALARLETT